MSDTPVTQTRSAGVRAKERHAPRPREAAARFVYVMARAGGAVKVGVSNNVARRRNGIQASSPDRVEIFHTERPVGVTAFAVEKAAMVLLAPWRTSGEWFRCKPELARLAVKTAAAEDARLSAFFPRFAAFQAACDRWDAAEKKKMRLQGNRFADRDARDAAADDERSTRTTYRELRETLAIDYPDEVGVLDPIFFMTDRLRPQRQTTRRLNQ